MITVEPQANDEYLFARFSAAFGFEYLLCVKAGSDSIYELIKIRALEYFADKGSTRQQYALGNRQSRFAQAG